MSFAQKINKRLSPYMKKWGFKKRGCQYYYIKNDIAYCIGLDSPGGVLYVTSYVMPLYLPCSGKYYTYGNRLNTIKDITLPLINEHDEESRLYQWCMLFCDAIEHEILPFFAKIDAPDKLVGFLNQNSINSQSPICCNEIHLSRLMFFTNIYLCPYRSFEELSMSYRSLLQRSVYLTTNVRQRYIEEIETLESMFQNSYEDAKNYLEEIISTTKAQCF